MPKHQQHHRQEAATATIQYNHVFAILLFRVLMFVFLVRLSIV